MIQVLITGCRGQLGTALQKTAPDRAAVTAIDLDTVDLTDLLAVRELFTEKRPELVINAAAYTAVDRAESEPEAACRGNRDLVANLARAAHETGARVIHISTDYVFDGTGHLPYRPDDPPNPRSVYGKSKLAGEQLLRETLPGASLVLRTAWLYSATGRNFVLTMLKLMRERDALKVVCDQIGTPTAADGLARAVWRAAELPELTGILHWTDAGVASWYDFAVAVQEEALAAGLLAREIEIHPCTTSEYPTPAERPAYSVLDKRPTELALGIRTEHWRKALRRVLAELASGAGSGNENL